VYRFAAFNYSPVARGLIHEANERIPVDDYKRGVEFYVAFVRGLDQLDA
jgi:carboxypeptidase PM20D1